MEYKYKILRYLYKKNGDNQYHDPSEAFRNKKLDVDFINDRIHELHTNGYIEVKLMNADYYNTNVALDNPPQVVNHAMIKGKGEDYVSERSIEIGKFVCRKRNFYLGLITALAVIVTLIKGSLELISIIFPNSPKG